MHAQQNGQKIAKSPVLPEHESPDSYLMRAIGCDWLLAPRWQWITFSS
jgi:hypothetical protein